MFASRLHSCMGNSQLHQSVNHCRRVGLAHAAVHAKHVRVFHLHTSFADVCARFLQSQFLPMFQDAFGSFLATLASDPI